MARRDGTPHRRDRRARPGDHTVCARALGNGDRLRHRLQVRHRLGGAARIRRRNCRAAPCWISRSTTRSCRRARCSRPARSIVGYALVTALLAGVAFAPIATLVAVERRDEPVLSRQFPVQGRSWFRSAAAARPITIRRSRSRRGRCAKRNCRYSPCWCRCSASTRCCRSSPRPCASSIIRSASSTSRSCWRRATTKPSRLAQALGLEGVFEIIRVPASLAADQAESLQFCAPIRARRIPCRLRRRGPAGTRPAAQGRRDVPQVAGQYRLPAVPPQLFQRRRKLADPHVHPRLLAVVRPGAAGPRTAQHADSARRHIQPFQDRRAARTARLGSVQRHRGCRSRHPPHAKGLSGRRRRFHDIRGGDLPMPAIGSGSARAG